MSKLVVSAIGPASSVQDGGRHGAQRYGLTPSGAMDRLALAAANCLVGNEAFAAGIEIGPFGAAFTAREGAVRVALAGAPRNADIAGRAVAFDMSVTLAEDETLTLGFARGGSFSYLAIEGGIQGEPMFGSLAVNARAGLGSPYPRPLQAGDELQTAAASGAPERRIDLPAPVKGPVRVVMGPQDDEFGDATRLFLDSEWKISATSDRMGYRLDGPVITHLYGHNIVSDGTVNGPRYKWRLSQNSNRHLSRSRAVRADSRRDRFSVQGRQHGRGASRGAEISGTAAQPARPPSPDREF